MTHVVSPSPAAGRHTFILETSDGQRLDLAVAQHLALSRTQAATLIATGRVLVDGRAERASFRATAGARVEVDVPAAESREITAEDIPVNVVHEDDHLVVIDKPAGMVVHPAPGHWTGTLMNALLGRRDAGATASVPRAGLVHRLDKDTSGLLIVAKDEATHRRLAADLAARRIARRYAALAWGHLDDDRVRVDAALGRDPRNRKRVAVVADGRRAVTDFVRVARFADVDLLRAHLHSGRTHQIRVHLKSIGHAVVGDATYGRAERRLGSIVPPRQFLHAAWLRFTHPATGVLCDLRSELPGDLRVVLAHAARDASFATHATPLAELGFFQTDA